MVVALGLAFYGHCRIGSREVETSRETGGSAFKGFPSGHGATLPAIMARLERTPMRYLVQPLTPDANREHADQAMCGYISVRVSTPTDMLHLIC